MLYNVQLLWLRYVEYLWCYCNFSYGKGCKGYLLTYHSNLYTYDRNVAGSPTWQTREHHNIVDSWVHRYLWNSLYYIWSNSKLSTCLLQ